MMDTRAENLLCGRLVDEVGPWPRILVDWVIDAAQFLAFALIDAADPVGAVFPLY